MSETLSIIVVSWNTRALLRECLASIAEHLAAVAHEVVVVDNASDDGSPDMVEADFPKVRLLRNEENVGFGRANNQAMRVAGGHWLLLLNSDTLLTDGSVASLLEQVKHQPEVGVAHCRVRYPDGRLQHTAYRFPSLRMALLESFGIYKLLGRRRAGLALLNGYWDHDEERDVDWVAGAFMLLPRVVFEQTSGFDERLFMYGEDFDWCQRISDRGWVIRFFPSAEIIHRAHSSADILYGDERVALCLRRQHDQFRQRHGALSAKAFMVVGIIGAGLRAAWYSARARLGGPRAQDYRDMEPSVIARFRTLLSMAMRR